MLKLSQMSNDHAMNVMGAMAIDLMPLIKDEELMAVVGNLDFEQESGEDNVKYFIRLIDSIASVIPLFAIKYRLNLFRVLGAFLQLDPEEVGKKNFFQTLADVKSIFRDEEVLNFLASLGRRERKQPYAYFKKQGDSAQEPLSASSSRNTKTKPKK